MISKQFLQFRIKHQGINKHLCWVHRLSIAIQFKVRWIVLLVLNLYILHFTESNNNYVQEYFILGHDTYRKKIPCDISLWFNGSLEIQFDFLVKYISITQNKLR